MTEPELVDIFRRAGAYAPFACSRCEKADIFVSGPHSHECEVCGEPALWGWYQQPRCAAHRTPEQEGVR